jgi:hypothetical protein
MNTLEEFEREISNIGTSKKSNAQTNEACIVHILNAFDQGERQLFYVNWERNLPKEVRARDPQSSKLEF